MVSVRLLGRLADCGKNFNIAIILDALNALTVKLCVMVVLNMLDPFVSLSLPFTVFQSHSDTQRLNVKVVFSCQFSSSQVRILYHL